MATVIDLDTIRNLPVAARREIIDLIEESIETDYKEGDDNDWALETEEELRVLNDRLEHHQKNPQDAITWQELKSELLKSKK